MISLFFLLNGAAQAEKEKVISEKNKYGGKTIEITYEKGEADSDEVIRKINYRKYEPEMATMIKK